MQATQHAFSRAGVVVLNEIRLQAGYFAEDAGVEALVEKTSLIAEYFGGKQNDFRDAHRNGLHQNTFSFSKFCRYLP